LLFPTPEVLGYLFLGSWPTWNLVNGAVTVRKPSENTREQMRRIPMFRVQYKPPRGGAHSPHYSQTFSGILPQKPPRPGTFRWAGGAAPILEACQP